MNHPDSVIHADPQPSPAETVTNESQQLPDDIVFRIDYTWSDDHGVGLSGWIFSRRGPLQQVEISVDDTRVPITQWQPRPDIAALFSQYLHIANCGFHVYVPRRAEHHIVWHITTESETLTHALTLPATPLIPPPPYTEVGGLFDEFIEYVNTHHLSVLEIGSRIVSPGSNSKRGRFHGAASYTGFDYYPASNTDIVGDSHRLSR